MKEVFLVIALALVSLLVAVVIGGEQQAESFVASFMLLSIVAFSFYCYRD